MTPLGAGPDDWLEDDNYRYTANLTRRGWAWEFLRRNAAFVGDLMVALERVSHARKAPKLSVLSLPRSLPGLAKWSLRFRQFSWRGSIRLLVSPPMRPCVASGCSLFGCRRGHGSPRIVLSGGRPGGRGGGRSTRAPAAGRASSAVGADRG